VVWGGFIELIYIFSFTALIYIKQSRFAIIAVMLISIRNVLGISVSYIRVSSLPPEILTEGYPKIVFIFFCLAIIAIIILTILMVRIFNFHKANKTKTFYWNLIKNSIVTFIYIALLLFLRMIIEIKEILPLSENTTSTTRHLIFLIVLVTASWGKLIGARRPITSYLSHNATSKDTKKPKPIL
jgi:energy-coupling factor transporter transmembrane protein EcfT